MLPRLKFEISALVIEMLDHLPATVWTDPNVTFLDPAMAGGQFLVEIIRKLRDNGHSDENIASRVYGLAEDVIDLGYAKRTKKLIGKYSVGSIETLEDWVKMGKKFDVVIGNPPYQAAVDNHQNRLWMQFVDKAFELAQDDGWVSMVTPNNWATTPKLYDKWFATKHVRAINMNECAKHFPGVGITFSWYIIQNSRRDVTRVTEFITPTTSFTDVLPVDVIGSNLDAISIAKKVMAVVGTRLVAYAPQTHYSYFAKGKVAKEQSSDYPHKVLLSPASSKRDATYVWGKVICDKQTGPRVITNMWPGNWQKMIVSDTIQTTHSFIHVPASSMVEANNMQKYLASKIITFVVQSLNSSRNINPRTISQLPKLDFTRSWTDSELYAHFNLTQDEIDLIEATVK